jgi:catechol 2,3-dioxygenase-like lactoylglutathione lyase family enzyme
MDSNNSRLREVGEQLIEMSRNASTQEDWQKIWAMAKPDISFEWGPCWKQSAEYRVDDFAAEVGFYFNVIGLSLFTLNPDAVMFTSPDKAFLLAVAPATDEEPAVHPNSFRVEFMVDDINATVKELESRGLGFDEVARPWGDSNPMQVARFRTPNGIGVTLWGMVETEPADAVASPETVAEPAS